MEDSALENVTWAEQRAQFHTRRMEVQTQIRDNHKLTVTPTPTNTRTNTPENTPTNKTTYDKPWNQLHWNIH